MIVPLAYTKRQKVYCYTFLQANILAYIKTRYLVTDLYFHIGNRKIKFQIKALKKGLIFYTKLQLEPPLYILHTSNLKISVIEFKTTILKKNFVGLIETELGYQNQKPVLSNMEPASSGPCLFDGVTLCIGYVLTSPSTTLCRSHPCCNYCYV